MDLHADALTDAVLVHARAQPRHGAHVFMTRGKHLVERFAAADQRRRAVVDDFQVSRADRHRIDVHQHLGASRHRDRLIHQTELAGIAKHPGPHVPGQRIRCVGFDLGWMAHARVFLACRFGPAISPISKARQRPNRFGGGSGLQKRRRHQLGTS
jgi:hypothetical protein